MARVVLLRGVNVGGHRTLRPAKLAKQLKHLDAVSIGAAGKSPSFEGVLNPNSSQKQFLLGPSQVDVGAGGTKVIVTSGKQALTLTPTSAPFSYQFVVKS